MGKAEGYNNGCEVGFLKGREAAMGEVDQLLNRGN